VNRVQLFGVGLGLLARVLVGTVWVVAGVLKLPAPEDNVRVVPVVGHGLPVLEILVGLCLLLGLLTRVAAGMSMLLLVAFVVGVGSAWARGLSIECGCFGGGAGPAANAQAKYPWEIARDLGLLALSAWLVVRPRTPWAVDNRLLPPEPVPSRESMQERETRAS
jgi:uncharacterized membrane protein YphA (DoxX/SURF4 family)